MPCELGADFAACLGGTQETHRPQWLLCSVILLPTASSQMGRVETVFMSACSSRILFYTQIVKHFLGKSDYLTGAVEAEIKERDRVRPEVGMGSVLCVPQAAGPHPALEVPWGGDEASEAQDAQESAACGLRHSLANRQPPAALHRFTPRPQQKGAQGLVNLNRVTRLFRTPSLWLGLALLSLGRRGG